MDEQQDDQTQGCFVIDGEDFPFPLLLEGFTMDEARIFFSYAGFPLEDLIVLDFDALDDDERAELRRKGNDPSTLAGLMHIAYLRGKPNAKESAIRKIVGSTDFFTAVSKFVAAEEEAGEVPPTEPQKSEPLTPSSEGSSGDSTTTSGDGSDRSSGAPVETPRRIGTSALGMSPTSRPIRQVV